MSQRFGEFSEELLFSVETTKSLIDFTLKFQENFSKDEVLLKDNKTPVTICDFACQAIIMSKIIEKFPNDYILGEESLKNADSTFLNLVKEILPKDIDLNHSFDHCIFNLSPEYKRIWVIDPIDGTYGFIKKQHYAIAMALLINNKIVVSSVAWPKHSNLLTNIKLFSVAPQAYKGKNSKKSLLISFMKEIACLMY